MHYASIKKYDVANGEGIRISLFVSGCPHHCKSCFNPEAWDYNYGKLFTKKEEDEIVDFLENDYIDGLSLLGGEPMWLANQEGLLPLLRRVKERFPKKSIWCYTGYLFDKEIMDEMYLLNDVTKEFESKPFFLINEIKNEKDEFLYIDKEEMKKVLGELITKELNSDNTKAEHNYYSFSLDKFIDYAKIFYITKNITAILACDFYKDYESRKIENLQRTKNIKKKEKYMKEDMEVER